MAASLCSIWREMEKGADVRGCIHWSLMDNFEWTSDYELKFGRFSVDRRTFARSAKPSAAFIGAIRRTNGRA
ncbi:MAG: family 1 glycosylhydrolase [Pseudomonadota bacterium]